MRISRVNNTLDYAWRVAWVNHGEVEIRLFDTKRAAFAFAATVEETFVPVDYDGEKTIVREQKPSKSKKTTKPRKARKS